MRAFPRAISVASNIRVLIIVKKMAAGNKFNARRTRSWLINELSFLSAGTQVRAQDDEGGDGTDANAEELCQDRPGDEYFRLSVEGDCRDVVR